MAMSCLSACWLFLFSVAPLVLSDGPGGYENISFLVSLPLSGSDMGLSMKRAAEHFIDTINAEQIVVPGRWIELDIYDDECHDVHAVTHFMSRTFEADKRYVAMGGLACSATAKSLAPIVDIMRLPLVSWGASLGELSNRVMYPRFFRTRMPEADTGQVIFNVFLMYGWASVAVGQGDTARFGDDTNKFVALMSEHGIRVVTERFVMTQSDGERLIDDLALERQRIVVLFTYEDAMRWIICSSAQKRYSGFVFITKKYASQFWRHGMPDECQRWVEKHTDNQIGLETQLYGHIQIGGIHLRRKLDVALGCLPGIAASEFVAWWTTQKGSLAIASDLAYNAVDGVCLMARALQVLFSQNVTVAELEARSQSTYTKFVQALGSVSFEGMTGEIRFEGTGDPVGILELAQTRPTEDPDRVFLGNWTADKIDDHGGIQWERQPTFQDENGRIQTRISANFPHCPPGEQNEGIWCRQCPPGSSKQKGGPGGCSVCSAGWYAADYGSVHCMPCPSNTIAAEKGAHQCTLCSIWEKSDGRLCTFDILRVLPLFLNFILAMLASGTFFHRVWVKNKISDIACVQGVLRATMLHPHRIHYAWRHGTSSSAFLTDTGHRELDGIGKGIRVRVVSPHSLELLDKDGNPFTDVHLESSKGFLHIPVINVLLDTRSRFLQLPAIFVIIASVVAAVTMTMLSVAMNGILSSGIFVAGAVLGGLGALWLRIKRFRTKTPLERRRSEYRRLLLKAGRVPTAITRGPSRALSIKQIEEVLDLFQTMILNRSMYYVCSNIVKPMTEPHKLSFAEVVGPKQVTWFTSHFWGTRFRDTVSSLKHHAALCLERYGMEDVNYWICTFANNQWNVASEMGDGVTTSSFYLALQQASGTAMIVNQDALPLERVWCLFEAAITSQLTHTNPESFNGLLLCTPSGILNVGQGTMETGLNLAKQLIDLDMRNASATRQEDKDMILDFVEHMEGGLDEVNRFVVLGIQNALDMMHECFETHFDDMMKDLRVCSMSSERPKKLSQGSQPVRNHDRNSKKTVANVKSHDLQEATLAANAPVPPSHATVVAL